MILEKRFFFCTIHVFRRKPLRLWGEKGRVTKRKRQADNCSAMRERKRILNEENNIVTELEERTLKVQKSPAAPKRLVLCSSQPYEKLETINQSYVVNLGILTKQLQNCQYCDDGPLDLANVCKEVTTVGLIPLLNVKCIHCNCMGTFRPAESHRTGKRGAAALDINRRAGLAALHTGIDHTQHSASSL